MKDPQDGDVWFFVDESGDSTFYNRRGELIVGCPGCSPILMLGFIETHDPKNMRQAILDLQQEVVNDRYLKDIPSLSKTAVAFHAKDDAPEVRYKFYSLLDELDFRAQFVVARKNERVFKKTFAGSKSSFYDHLVKQLFQDVLHRYTRNHVYFAKRGSRDRQVPVEAAIVAARARFEEKWDTKVTTSVDTDLPLISRTPKMS